MIEAMLKKGPWTSPWQLPKKYIPGLKALPWFDDTTDYPELRPLVQLLEKRKKDLEAEYEILVSR